MFGTRFTGKYAVSLPLVSAGMAFVTGPELVAAVSNAGGLGILGTGPMPPELLRRIIGETRALTRNPFGVNLIVEETALGPASTYEQVQVCVETAVSPVVFFWNPPPAKWLDTLRDARIDVWLTVSSAADARRARDAGYDAVIVQSAEAGGHLRANDSALSLWPKAREVIGDMMMIVAGGIADGRTAAAAFALGADAVCLGTRFVACAESKAHADYKSAIVRAQSDDTSITRIFGPEWPDAPMRVIRNQAVHDSERGVTESRSIGQTSLFGQRYDMPPRSAILATRDTSGNIEQMCLAAGTSVGLVDSVEPAGALVTRIMRDATQVLAGLAVR